MLTFPPPRSGLRPRASEAGGATGALGSRVPWGWVPASGCLSLHLHQPPQVEGSGPPESGTGAGGGPWQLTLPSPSPSQMVSSRLRPTCHLPSRLPIAEHSPLLMVLVLLLKAKVSGLRAPWASLCCCPPRVLPALLCVDPGCLQVRGWGVGTLVQRLCPGLELGAVWGHM